MVNNSNDKFRFDINALRAIAVTGVVFYHFKLPFFNGGFSGVDIFFVISGYLMSKIVFIEFAKKTFSYKDFLIKRIKRIVPALLFVITTVTLISFFLYFPDEFKLQTTNALYSLLFYSNFWYIKHLGYFDPLSSSNIYLHTWSLSVEFQFYLFYPIFLILLNKLTKKRSVIILIFTLSIIAIFFFSIWRTKINGIASFFLLPTRSWELIIGGFVFLIEENLARAIHKKILAIIGYILIVLSFLFLKSNLAWPGVYTWLPVGATCLIIMADANEFKLIRSRLIQNLGKISYSLYLWHWPVIVLGQYLGIGSSYFNNIALILISIGLASFTYSFIEMRKFDSFRLTVCLGFITTCIFLFTRLPVNRFVFKKASLEMASYAPSSEEKRKQFSEGKCYIVPGGVKDLNKGLCLKFQQGKRNILLLGDSHAAELSESLHDLLISRNVNLMQSTASGCLPLLDSHGESQCTDIMTYIYNDFIVNNHKKIDGVILTANWLKGYEDPQNLIRRLDSTINYFKKYNLKIILIGQTESYSIPFHIILAREIQYNTNLKYNYTIKDGETLNNLLKARFPECYIDIYNLKNIPNLNANHVPYLIDTDHFSKYGADLAAKKIISNSISTIVFKE